VPRESPLAETIACYEHPGAPAAAPDAAVPSFTIEICGPDIPTTLLRAAEALVDSPYACLAYLRAFQPEIIPRLQHAVLRNNGTLIGILSFYVRQRSLIVVNRLLRLSDEVLDACVAALFERCPTMRSVAFTELYNEAGRARVRSFTWRTIDCVAVELPRSYPEYLAHFGPATRKNLRYCARRLEREAPGVRFRISRRGAIGADVVAAIVQLNHRRMALKGRSSGIDALYTSRLAALSESHGVACLAMDGTTIVAGALCAEVGRGWTLHVIAHDPRFNHVRLGLLCLLKAVEEAIACGVPTFNFLWGVGDYKLLFGGKVSALRARRYYRDVGSQLLALGDLRDCALQSLRRRLSSWRRRLRTRRQ
jgi:hypothetical protein